MFSKDNIKSIFSDPSDALKLDTIISKTKADASNRLFSHTDGAIPMFDDLSKEAIDGLANGFDDVLYSYKNNGYVDHIGRTKDALASYSVPDRWQPWDAFDIGDLTTQFKKGIEYADVALERLQDRISPLIQRPFTRV